MSTKVHPHSLAASSTACSSSRQSSYITSKQETFTVWMKSLVFNGRGCTVYDSNGNLVYWVDNYDCKRFDEVCLMDLDGKVLFTFLRKKLSLLRSWEGYENCERGGMKKRRPGFRMRESFNMFRGGDSSCKVTAGLEENQPHLRYSIKSCISSACTYKIEDSLGRVIAQVKRKQSGSGVDLGEDVLTMVVEPQIDHSFITSLVIVYSLINSLI